jgi:uncharacterized protein with GYD domain
LHDGSRKTCAQYIGAPAGARPGGRKITSIADPVRATRGMRVARLKEHAMPKYLMETTYTPEGVRALQKDKASARREAVTKLLQSVDGKLEAFYYAMGDRDVIAIVELPDATSAAAVSLTGSATGLYKVRTTPLLSVEEVDRALARKLAIRAPGQ